MLYYLVYTYVPHQCKKQLNKRLPLHPFRKQKLRTYEFPGANTLSPPRYAAVARIRKPHGIPLASRPRRKKEKLRSSFGHLTREARARDSRAGAHVNSSCTIKQLYTIGEDRRASFSTLREPICMRAACVRPARNCEFPIPLSRVIVFARCGISPTAAIYYGSLPKEEEDQQERTG